MTYFGVLLRFVVVPLLVLRFLIWRDRQRGKQMPPSLQSWPEDAVLLAHAAVAVAYTTPWDNYLVATNIWSYDKALVTGYKIGYVPIEEYSFFVLQALLSGSWVHYIAHHLPSGETSYHASTASRVLTTGLLGTLWLASIYRLWEGKDANRYISLILGWGLPPLMLQTGFGADILWRHRRLVAAGILLPTTYLGIADSLAIGSGTWKINPEKTVQRDVIKDLPLEELLFFLITNVLLVCGIILVQAKESENRLPKSLKTAYFRFKAHWVISQTTPTITDR